MFVARFEMTARRLTLGALTLGAVAVGASVGGVGAAAEPQPTVLKTEHFDRDPGWEEHHNRIVPAKLPVVTQDFGYGATRHASLEPGEIGGRITRTTKPAWYAAELSPVALDEPLSASGSFAMTAAQPGAGVFFGWFNAQQPGGSGRPIGSLGLHFDFEAKGGRLAVRLITGTNQSCGTFITPYLPGKYRTTPLKLDGTRYDWTLNYDPTAAAGAGEFTFALASANHPPIVVDATLPAASQAEERARFPTTKTFRVPLPAGYKQQLTKFDRFGVMNMMKAGGTASIFFGNLRLGGKPIDLRADPGWTAVGNHAKYEDREVTGAHNFGYSAATNHAGGKPGEIGGDLWRSGDYGYYADRVGPLSLDRKLEARGRVTMLAGGPDADMMLGWFSGRDNPATKDASPIEAGNFIGVAVGGPTRVGHYFAPSLTTAKGSRGKVDSAPLLRPGVNYEWSFVYDPAAAGGLGSITVRLGDESVTLALKPGQKAEGARLDQFGLFTSQAGGQMVRIYLDDVSYSTAAR